MMLGTMVEFHFGIVTNNNDPEKRGRLKVQSQSLTGVGTELPDWVEPESPLFTSSGGGGSLFLPLVGSTVELMVDVHDAGMDQVGGERFLQNPSAKWRHATPTAAAGKVPLPVALKTNYPHRRGWVTPAGNKIIMDDTKNGETIIIESKHGHKIEMRQDEIHVSPVGTTVLKSPTLMGEGATELMVLGNAFLTLFNSHFHNTGVGPTSPASATTPMTTAHLSAEGNKVK